MHNNLFHWTSPRGVYEKFQEDARRDVRQGRTLTTFGSLCAVAAYYDLLHLRIWLALVAVGLFESSLRTFIDNSNRNWAMHVIDWLEASGVRPHQRPE